MRATYLDSVEKSLEKRVVNKLKDVVSPHSSVFSSPEVSKTDVKYSKASKRDSIRELFA